MVTWYSQVDSYSPLVWCLAAIWLLERTWEAWVDCRAVARGWRRRRARRRRLAAVVVARRRRGLELHEELSELVRVTSGADVGQ